MPAVEETAKPVRLEPEQYPWHNAQWTALTRNLERLPHALLLHGQNGLGKNAFALRLARYLLCLQRGSDGQVCGRCRSCTLFRAGNHPDLLCVRPQEDSSNILVDQIRGVIEFLAFKAHTATHKIVIISPAEAMNVNASNSLLKILEEPPAGTVLVLVATHLSRVAVTVRSRCRRVVFNVPPATEALAWLQPRAAAGSAPENLLAQAGGAPLTALALTEQHEASGRNRLLTDLTVLAQGKTDPVACAERWKAAGTDSCLEWLHRFVSDTISSQAASLAQRRSTVALAGNNIFFISIIDLFDFLDNVSISKRQLGTGIDETLILESLLIRWCDMTASAG